ncbi:cutinase family protein [Mycolicibacterium agri]|uniref:Cutinase family protein n=1 Tax=Mycolicibacterium agri TaxID=36811 RepID=A0A2A7N0I3_MYCAG|nr:cutinase family protein [Mycolicibacterium agri]PEG37330.1 cutinase family protein [Mycolicibacterium agri]GFG52415.1 serine esterase [Mycolicibacterium agri]
MRAGHIAITIAATAAGLTLAAAPSASAEPCPDVEVVFARGTAEAPGLGPTGEAFVEALRSRIGDKSMEVYPVNYPATTDFPRAVDGIRDASAKVESVAAACPDTRIVLGGFSQGAAVAGFVTADVIPDGVPEGVPNPMPADVAEHVAAVALFGTPNERFMRVINQPDIVVGPLYADKTIDLCVPEDFVCSSGRDWNAHTQYKETGMVDQAATFVAAKLATPQEDEETPGDSDATPRTPTVSPLSTGRPHLGTPAAPQLSTTPAAPQLSTIPVAPPAPPPAPQPHLQPSPETIASCATECRVVGPE